MESREGAKFVKLLTGIDLRLVFSHRLKKIAQIIKNSFSIFYLCNFI